MARACGLRIGPRGYELVLLDGSARKHKVVASEAGELSFTADPDGAVEILKGLAKRHDIPKDALRVVIEGGVAAFRKVNLPINDNDKIEKVIKFEVESELPQFNIEDVVVDGSARGRGVGEALNRAAIDRARAAGATTVDLTSRPSREAANRLYRRLGFEQRTTNVYRLDL